MADLKISQLNSIVTVVPATDVLPVVQGGTTLKITPNQILGAGGTATLASATITGALTVDTTTLVVNAAGYTDKVGIGTATPDATLDVTSAGTASTYTVSAVIQDGTYPASGNPTLELNGFIGGNGYRSGIGSIGGQQLAFYIPTTYGVAPTLAMTLNSTANLVLKGGTAAATGVGVTFPAAQVASSDANCLDDYEEGTFTPVLTTDGVNFTSVAYIIQEAKYTKIGRLVTISGTIYTSSVVKGSASGNAVITGLPFAQPGGDVLGGGNCNASSVWLADNPIEFIVSGSSVVLLKRATSTGASANLVVADVGTGSSNFVRFSGQYYV